MRLLLPALLVTLLSAPVHAGPKKSTPRESTKTSSPAKEAKRASFELRPQAGHSQSIDSLATTSDGRYALTASGDGTTKIWELATGREVRSLGTPDRSADRRRAVFSANARLVYMSRSANFALVFDAFTGTVVGTFESTGHQIARSADGRFVAVGDANLVVMEAGADQRGRSSESMDPFFGSRVSPVYAEQLFADLGLRPDPSRMEFSFDGKFVLLLNDSQLAYWSTKEKKVVARIEGLKSAQGFAASRDGKTAAIADASGVSFYSMIDQRRLGGIPSLKNVRALTFSPDGQRVAAVDDKALFVLDAPFTGEPRRAELTNHTPAFVAFAEGGRDMVTAGGRDLVLVDGQSLREIRRMTPNVAATRALEFSPQQRRLLVRAADGAGERADVWNLDEARLELGITANGLTHAWFGPGGESLIVADSGGVFSVALEGRQQRQLATGKYSFVEYQDGRLLTCAAKQCEYRDAADGKVITQFPWTYGANALLMPGGLLVGYQPSHRGDAYNIDVWQPTAQGLGAKKTEWREVKGHALHRAGEALYVTWYREVLRCLPASSEACAPPSPHQFSVEYMSRLQSFAATDHFLASSGDITGTIYKWDLKTGDQQNLYGHSRPGAKVAFSHDGALLATGGADGGVRLWDAQSGTLLAQLLSSGERWLITTPDGYFDASRDGGELLAMVRDNHAYAVDQFALRNNRPDILLERLASPRADIREHYRSRYLRRLAKAGFKESDLSGELQVPEARIRKAEREGDNVALELEFSDARAPLRSYNVFVNDVPLFAGNGKPVTGSRAQARETVALLKGANKIEVSVVNARGAESFRALTMVQHEGESKGDLYFLGFGVSRYSKPELALGFAHKDAQDLSATFSRLRTQFTQVNTQVLVDDAVTPDAIRQSKEFLARSGPQDTVVLFIAGHGMHDSTVAATYYFLTHGADPQRLAETSADFELIEELLQGIGARRKLFLMDTCESGEAEPVAPPLVAELDAKKTRAQAVRGIKRAEVKAATTAVPTPIQRRAHLLQENRFIYNDLVRRSGAIVFSSSRGGELSYESEQLSNGFFTHAVQQGLGDGAADTNGDRSVGIDELRAYVAKTVAAATNDAQHPTIDRDNLTQRFGFQLPADKR